MSRRAALGGGAGHTARYDCGPYALRLRTLLGAALHIAKCGAHTFRHTATHTATYTGARAGGRGKSASYA